jgi:hypothetical protein
MGRSNAPAPAITGDVYRISLYMTNQNQVCINSFDVMGDQFASSPGANMVALLNAWALNNQTAFLTCMATLCRLNYYLMQCLSSNVAPSIQKVAGASGSVATAPLPIEMAAIIKKTSALKGQHGRGRCFLPAVPVTFTTNTTDPNNLNAAALITYTALCTSILTPTPAGGRVYTPCISTRPIGPLHVVTNAVAMTDANPVALLATQRRRKIGRGI